MALEIALEIKGQIEAMGFEAVIHGDDWNRHYVTANTRGERRRFDSLREFEAWKREWMDTHHSGGR